VANKGSSPESYKRAAYCTGWARQLRPWGLGLLYGTLFVAMAAAVAGAPLPLEVRLSGVIALSLLGVYGVVEPLYFASRSRPAPMLRELARGMGFGHDVLVAPGRSYYAGLAVGWLPRLRFIVVKEYVSSSLPLSDLRCLLAHEGAHLSNHHPLKQALYAAASILVFPWVEGLAAKAILLLAIVLVMVYMIRLFEVEAARYAMALFGEGRYRESIRRIDSVRGRGNRLVRWWYSFTHPHA